MNGFAEHGLSEEAFGQAKGGIASFDAFPKTKRTYLTASPHNSVPFTVFLVVLSLYLSATETARWWAGTTTQTFSVEKAVAHELQLNLDMVVAMRCADLHVNMQDAAGDRTLAAELLRRDPTTWRQWARARKGAHHLGTADDAAGLEGGMGDVHDRLGAARHGKKWFSKTPRVRGTPDACRVYGSLEANKVQGDFHVTARGHGYMEFGEHLDHSAFNFSHLITELSFGPFYPSLTNPLDNTVSTTDAHFHKYQYYLSIVPTIYTDDPALLALPSSVSEKASSSVPPPAPPLFSSRHIIHTNQYAATSQSRPIPESAVPGIFFKFDIEPITLTISEQGSSFLSLLVRLVNVVAGVVVAGGWVWTLVDWAGDVWGRRRRRRAGGVLGVGSGEKMGLH